MKYTLLSENVTIKKVSETDNAGIFEIEGLYAGYGLTLGNSLRRALLSSLPGAAITQVKIKGVGHEFSTISGVAEDVVELTLNLKKVRFRFFSDEPQALSLKVKGEKKVTAADIKTNAQIEVINSDLHIATLTGKNSELDMEITVEKGMGYVPVEMRKIEKLPIGTVALDALFTPVTRVNFTVEDMRVGELTNYNKLRLSIETDGSIMPSLALHKVSNILKDHFDKISMVSVPEVSEKKSAGIAEVKEKKERKVKKEAKIKKAKK